MTCNIVDFNLSSINPTCTTKTNIIDISVKSPKVIRYFRFNYILLIIMSTGLEQCDKRSKREK